jgi:hypothetical protein
VLNPIALPPNACESRTGSFAEMDMEMLVKSVTDAVMGAIDTK